MTGPILLALHVICENPPGQYPRFGLQDKQKALHPGQPGPGGEQVFTCTVQAKPGSDGNAVFTGTFAHGTPDDRFLYLSLRAAEETGEVWLRRIKVRLNGITWEQAERAHAEGRPLITTIDGTYAGSAAVITDWMLHGKEPA